MNQQHRTAHFTATAAILIAGLSACGGNSETWTPSPPPPTLGDLGPLKGSTKDVTVELHEGTNMAAAPSPDGKQIAFTAQGALWILPAAGGTATRISSWDMEPTAPVWSPNGRSIAFQNYTTGGNYHIWTVEPNGGNPRELTTGFFDDREPAWTPDGSAIVFSSDRGNDGQYKIWSFNLASGAYTQLTKGPGAESNPAVSPDGKQIAFVDAAKVYTAPLAGGAPALVAPGMAPAWAKDGGLVYQTPAGALNAGGKDIVTGEDLFPFPVRFLANGNFLYTADGRLRLRDAAGGNLTEIPFSASLTVRRPVFTKLKDRHFDDFGPRPVKGISAPVISPDGKSVAFVALNDVWMMRIGEAPMRLTNDTDRDGNVQWTPDGKSVYFSTEKNNGGALAIDQISLTTMRRTRLAAIPGKSMVSPMMSPKGDRIAYTTLSGQLEIWTLATHKAEEIIKSVSTQVSTPQWTPDGTKIMLVDNERMNNRFREGYNKLRVIDIASKTAKFYPVAEIPRQISDREEGAAALSPDGKTVALIIDSVLHTMPVNPDGSPAGPASQLTKEVADLPSWAADSKTILYKSADKLKTIRVSGAGAGEIPVNLTWTQKAAPGTTIIRAGALWDGIAPTLQRDVDIVIQRNRIVAIRPHRANAERGAAKYIDASRLTVLPGLWDPHIHPLTLYNGGQFGQIAALFLSYGITSTQSVAGPLHQSIEMREALDAGNLIGPRLFVSPPLWEGNRLFYSFARTLRTPEVADLEISKSAALDVDYLKSYVRAPIPIMAKIAQAGLDRGIPSGTHMLAPGAATGLAGTTHLSATQRMGYGWSKSTNGFTYQDAYDLHAKADFHVTDTLFASMALVGQDKNFVNDERFKLLVPPNFVPGLQRTAVPDQATLARVRKEADQSIKVQKAGGLLAIGTDAPLVAPGISLHTGLRSNGIASSNFQALQNVTINAAKMSFVDRDLGSVEVGKLADLTIVDGNPLADLKAAANVKYVVKNGVSYSLAQILAPFKTRTAMEEHRKAQLAYQKMCAASPDACETMAHAD